MSHLLYIGLKGGREPGEFRFLSRDLDRSQSLAEEAMKNFKNLVREFDDPERPYPSQPRARFARDWGDYDLLARRAEWSVAGGEDGDG